MSKRLLIFVYVMAVLLFSGFAANSKPLPQIAASVYNAHVFNQTGILKIVGQINPACQTQPLVNIPLIDHKNHVIHLQVLVSSKPAPCSTQITKSYVLAYDLKALALAPNALYVLHINNYAGSRERITYATSESTNGFSSLDAQTRHVSGTLVGNILYKNGVATSKIISPFIDGRDFGNKRLVWIKGYLLITTTLDPFSEAEPLPTLLAISMSSLL